ncbi:transposase [Trichonephila clavipes]|uniref:Transposase n=1 Tax=Trichonephila clavipes TaxID=2585209 RepID=A0A8X6VL78_TRICX|nr:transposase [Trichonephila clavipes]
MLKEGYKKKRMDFALDFLTRYAEAGDEFLDHIVTGDETWVYHHTPESKQQSMQWHHSISTKKIMASVFWDRLGILLLEFMPPGTTKLCCCILPDFETSSKGNSKQTQGNVDKWSPLAS